MSTPPPPTVSAIVLAWKAEPWLLRCIEALLTSRDVQVEVVLVDNGCTTDDVEKYRGNPQVKIVGDGDNLGYAGGNNLGAAAATGEYLALVNGDLVVEPTTLRRLIDVMRGPDVGMAVASVRLADDPALVNAGANPVHVLGLSWSGGMGKPETQALPVDTAAASGACVMTTLAHWRRLDGFDAEYFAYHEDTELSLRTHCVGLRVLYVPDAVGVHRYEFSRNPFKMYMSERNRLMFVLTMWPARALMLLFLPLLGLEVAMLAMAVGQGWAGAKVRGWRWLWANRAHIKARRRQLLAERTVPDREWMGLLTTRVDQAFFPVAFGRAFLNALVTGWWAVARRLI